MTKPTFLALAVFLGFQSVSFAHGGHGLSVWFQDRDRQAEGCSGMVVKNDGDPLPITQESVSIPLVEGRTLKVTASRNGGVRVGRGSGDSYRVHLCKAAVEASSLARIRLQRSGDELSVSGPDSEQDWVGFLFIEAPENASMSIESTNSPIDLSDVSGTFRAHAVNGPLSVKTDHARIDGSTTNGPISYTGGGGDVRLRAQNGPISVRMRGEVWNGKGLEASSQNGPLSVVVSPSYRSSLLVESDGRSPWDCARALCGASSNDESPEQSGYEHRLRLGTGEPVVRITTSNGPVTIRTTDTNRKQRNGSR